MDNLELIHVAGRQQGRPAFYNAEPNRPQYQHLRGRITYALNGDNIQMLRDNREFHVLRLPVDFIASVSAYAFSPNGLYLVCTGATGSEAYITMYRISSLENCLSDAHFHRTSLIASDTDQVRLNWGSRNTQFVGLASRNDDTSIIDGPSCNNPDEPHVISWSSSSEYFSVNFVNGVENGCRCFHVYKVSSDDEFSLHCVNRTTYVGMQGATAWRPNSTMFVTPYKTHENDFIGLFEYGSLLSNAKLPVRGAVEKATFARDGRALAVWQRADTIGDVVSIFLYTCGRFVLKNRIDSDRSAEMHDLDWLSGEIDLYSDSTIAGHGELDEVSPVHEVDQFSMVAAMSMKESNVQHLTNMPIDHVYTLRTIHKEFVVTDHILARRISRGLGDHRPLAYVDGHSVSLYSAKYDLSPYIFDPIYLPESETVTMVRFSQDGALIAIITSSRRVYIGRQISPSGIVLDAEHLSLDTGGCAIVNGFWIKGNRFVVVCTKSSADSSLDLPRTIVQLPGVPDIAVTAPHEYFEITVDGEKAPSVEHNSLGSKYPKDILCSIGEMEPLSQTHCAMLLDKEQLNAGEVEPLSLNNLIKWRLDFVGTIWMGDKQFQEMVTSLIVDGRLLLMTSRSHLFIRLIKERENTDVQVADLMVRSIEANSRILHYHPENGKVFLHTPRGNIEAINVRHAVIQQIEHFAQNQKWDKAYYLCKLHRFNLNVLVDLNVDRFIEAVPIFVQLISVQEIIQFILELHSDNELTKYDNIELFLEVSGSVNVVKSKAKICEAFVKYFMNTPHQDVDSLPAFFLATLFLSSDKPDLVTAMKMLRVFVASENNIALDNDNSLQSAELNTLKTKYIGVILRTLTQIDHNANLFEVALQTLDLNFAELIARSSRADPMEYLPVLNKLRVQPHLVITNFMIHDQTRNYLKASYNLVDMIIDDQRTGTYSIQFAIAYFKRHGVFDKVLQYLRSKTDRDSELLRVMLYNLALQMEESRNYRQAAVLFKSAGYPLQAYKNFIDEGMHREALDEINKLPKPQRPPNYIQTAARKLLELQQVDAAELLLVTNNAYVEDVVQIFLDFHHFAIAHSHATANKRPDLIESNLNDALRGFIAPMQDDLTLSMDTFNAHFERLIEIRKQREAVIEEVRATKSGVVNNPLDVFRTVCARFHDVEENGVRALFDNEDDAASVFAPSSMGTRTMSVLSSRQRGLRSTASSSRSSRSSRKQAQRKRRPAKIRRGMPHEDAAIIRELYCIIESVFAYTPYVKDLLGLALIVDGTYRDLIIPVIRRVVNAQQRLADATNVIWTEDFNQVNIPHLWGDSSLDESPASIAARYNINLLDIKHRSPPPGSNKPLFIAV